MNCKTLAKCTLKRAELYLIRSHNTHEHNKSSNVFKIFRESYIILTSRSTYPTWINKVNHYFNNMCLQLLYLFLRIIILGAPLATNLIVCYNYVKIYS